MKAGGFFLTLIFCLSLFGLAACVPSKPTKKEIVGHWVERRETSRIKDTGPCAYFDFTDEGQFYAHHIPIEYFILERSLPLEYLTRVDATGSWTLDTSSEDPFAFHRINLRFGPVPGYPIGFSSHLLITFPPERVLLAGVADDPWVTFYKQSDSKCE